MTPKEKATELYAKMELLLSNTEFNEEKIKQTKAATMVVIDEIMQLDLYIPFGQEENYVKSFYSAVRKELQEK